MARTGRPKGTNNKNVICSLRMDETTRKKLEEYCVKNKVVKSVALRRAIDLLIEQEN